MEQELIEHEEVSELHEVRSEISFHVQEIQGENEYNEIQTSADHEQLSISREGIVNDDAAVAEAMLHESRQIAHDVTREQVMLFLLDFKNKHADKLKDDLKQIKKHHEDSLELDLKPNVYREEQYCSQIQMQLNNSETMINKLKAVLQDIESKHEIMQEQKKKLQQECEVRQKMFKALLDKKVTLLNEHNKRMELLKSGTDLRQYLERIMQLEDCLKLKLEQKNIKIERNDEIKKVEDQVALQQKTLDDVNTKKKEILLELDALNREVDRFRENKANLLYNKIDLREAAIVGNDYKMRKTALQNEITLLKKAIRNKENSRSDLPTLRETLIKLEKENETLRAHNQDVEQKIENVYQMLQTLQKLKEENHCNLTKKLEQEKVLLLEAANITSLENKQQIINKQLDEEIKLSEELKQSTKNYQETLAQKKQQFEIEMCQLTECLNEHNTNYDKSSAYKDIILNKKECDRNNNEQLIKLKLVEVDNMRKEIEEAKEELNKTLELVDKNVRLKDKLAKDKTRQEEEYNTKYTSIFGMNSSLSDNVRGILKSPKKVTFQGLSSLSSSQTLSQDDSAASKATTENMSFFDLFHRKLSCRPTVTPKKPRYRLDSPEKDFP